MSCLLALLLLAPLDLVPSWQRLEAELVPPAGAARHGAALAVAGQRVAAGAPDPSGGRVLVWRRGPGGWVLEATLAPSDGAAGDGFGAALAFDGATLVVGAPERAGARGAAYVFTLAGTSWTQRTKLAPATLAVGDRFGAALALRGSELAVGAPGDDLALQEAGSVRIYAGAQGLWSQQALLTAASPAAGAGFGAALALELGLPPAPHTLLVGAPARTSASLAGSAHVFVGGGAAWSEQARLAAASPALADRFGESVAMLGELALVGAPGTHAQTGAVHAFQRTGAAWSGAHALDASWYRPGDRFGASLALDAEAGYDARALIGAPGARASALGPGVCLSLVRLNGTWYVDYGQRHGPPDGREDDECGAAVAWMDVPGEPDALQLSGAPSHVEGTLTGALYAHRLDVPALASCFGGIPQACPCGNGTSVGGGCDNADGTGGVRLDVLGYEGDGAGNGRAGFLAIGFPAGSRPLAVLLEAAGAPAAAAPFGDGLLCLASAPARVASARASDGRALLDLQHAGAGGIHAYQLVYRNRPASFCDAAAAFNTSNSMQLAW